MPTLENNFIFTCERLPVTQQFIKTVTLPEVTLGQPEYAARQQDIKIPGHKFTFGEVDIEFILAEDFSNHKEIYTWLNNIRSYNGTNIASQMSDASITVLSNNKQPLATIKLTGMFPTLLGSCNFTFSNVSGNMLSCLASFAITDWRYV